LTSTISKGNIIVGASLSRPGKTGLDFLSLSLPFSLSLYPYIYIYIYIYTPRPCGLVDRVPGYDPRGPGFDSRFFVNSGSEMGSIRLHEDKLEAT
jgi:hypothetical protein